MSAALRPSGDVTASFYGTYMSEQEVLRVKVGTTLNMLCNDHMNYRVEVKKNVNGMGHLHFVSWANRYDYKGSLLKLYLAKEGTHNVAKDNFYSLEDVEEQRKKIEAMSSGLSSSGMRDDDGFRRPRMPLRPNEQSESATVHHKRNAESSGSRNLSDSDRDGKRAATSEGVVVSAGESGRPQRNRPPRMRYDPDAEETRSSVSHRRKPGVVKERDMEDSDMTADQAGGGLSQESYEGGLMHSNFSIMEESELEGADFSMEGVLSEEEEPAPALGQLVMAKLVIVDEQLGRLREARSCIDDAISRLERIKSSQLKVF